MDDKMSDKKKPDSQEPTEVGDKWREIELMYIEGGTFEGGEEEVFVQGFVREEEYLFIEKAAYQAEKQRADSLQEKLDDEADLLVKTHNKLMEQRQRADRLEKENQKLKEALENAMGSIYFTDTELWNELKEALK